MTKDDGIVLVNHKKNHNLISNIDTYQIGGVAGYEFKYKNENGKFAGASKVSAKKNTTVRKATTRYEAYQHKINIDNVTGSHVSKPNEDMKLVINSILNDEKVINLNYSRVGDVEGMLISSYSDSDVSYNYSWNDDKCYITNNDYEYVRT